ncbi:hypothetical protein Q7P37_006756 [Cladosporium fusiforme]
MLSLARSNAPGRCIHCAIRSQRLTLQQLRLGSTSSRAPRKHGTKENRGSDSRRPSVIRYTGGQREGSASGKDGALRKRFNAGKQDRGFPEMLQERLKVLKEELKDTPLFEHYKRERMEQGDKKAGDFGKTWHNFTKDLRQDAEKEKNQTPLFGARAPAKEKPANLAADLKEAWAKRGQRGLDDRIKYSFYAHITGSRFTESDIKNQKDLADLRYPTEWYPGTRTMRRTIHLHVGPTNSGKTYHALQRLEAAGRGVYAGPLRLLAHEVYTRMTAKGKACSLVTGEERRLPEEDERDMDHHTTSCTVEMVPLNRELDVAVIDEIQMIGNAERGWAWTQALLGVRAKEVHLCGEVRTVPLIKELCASVGEKLVIHNYERLSPLKVADESLNGKIADLRKGDCIVSFSVMGIHALRKQIERVTGRKVATVYGSLPPETRAQQARLFNDPDNDYDFLVASDAVGMGLNLAIKRVIFEAANKFDGAARRTLSVADIKQIAGRAGRYRTAAQATEDTAAAQAESTAKGENPSKAVVPDNVGIVTTLEKFDFPVVRAAMHTEPEPIRTAGIFPPSTVLERFSSYFPPGTPFSYILTRLHELSLMHKRFHLCGLKDHVWVADLIEPIQSLTINDRNIICSAPASQTDADLWRELMPAYARIIAEQSGGSLIDIPQLPLEILEAEVSPSREYLRALERLHKGVVTYLWLSYRFAGLFTTRALAFHVKQMVEEKIEDVLGKFSFTEAQRRKLAAKREKELRKASIDAEVDAEGNPVARENMSSTETELDDDAQNLEPNPLDDQTTLTSGGDRFSGEEDFGFEDPQELDAEIEAETETEPEKQQAASSSFAQWRSQQVKGESQGSNEPEGAAFESAHVQGEEVGRKAVQNKTVQDLAASEPTILDAQPTYSSSDLQDPLDLGSYTILDLPFEQPAAATQEAPPAISADAEKDQKPKE